jgi:hypothetical protein
VPPAPTRVSNDAWRLLLWQSNDADGTVVDRAGVVATSGREVVVVVATGLAVVGAEDEVTDSWLVGVEVEAPDGAGREVVGVAAVWLSLLPQPAAATTSTSTPMANHLCLERKFVCPSRLPLSVTTLRLPKNVR